MNKALAVMSGDYWACLSSDDLYRPSTVGLAVTAFQANHEIDIVYGDLEIISENGVYLAPYRYPEFDKKRFRLNMNPCQHGHACTFLRARVYDDMGGFDERYKYAGDYEYFLRATEHGINMLHQPTLRAQMTIHALQISNKYRNEQWQEHVSIYQRYYGTPRMNAWSLIDNTRRYIRNRRYYLSKILLRPCG